MIIVTRVTDIVIESEDTRGMQVGFDIGNESNGYCLTVVSYSVNAGRY